MLRFKSTSFLLPLFAGALVGGSPVSAQAGEVLVTPIEWAALPDFCRPAILISGYRTKLQFELRGNAPEGRPASMSLSLFGGIPGPHHFCVGLVYLNRAKRGADRYDTAINEFKYSYDQMSRTAPFFSYVSASLGRALYGARRKEEAAKVWSLAMVEQPERREAYLAMAEALNNEKRPEMALKVLQKYEQSKEADYPDAEHFLAQTYFDLQRYAEAKAHAERAYALGYPVYGLRDRMKRMGKW